MRTLVLFDLDGTLMLTGPGAFEAFDAAGQLVCGPLFTLDRLDRIDRRGRLDPWLFRAAAAAAGYRPTDADHDRFRLAFVDALPRALARQAQAIRVMPGIPPLLADLRQRDDLAIGMVSGNYSHSARIKLLAGHIDPDQFTYNGFAEEAAERAELVELAIRRFTDATGNHLDRQRVIVVGDTPHDVACAKATGCRCLAVATGHFTTDELRQAGADVVVDDLADPSPLWRMIE